MFNFNLIASAFLLGVLVVWSWESASLVSGRGGEALFVRRVGRRFASFVGKRLGGKRFLLYF